MVKEKTKWNLTCGKFFKGYFLIFLLQSWIQKPMLESKENGGQEKETADLTKIISMFMDPSYLWERILNFCSGFFLIWFLVLENVIHLLREGEKIL